MEALSFVHIFFNVSTALNKLRMHFIYKGGVQCEKKCNAFGNHILLCFVNVQHIDESPTSFQNVT